jgi:hypothetical protein
VNKFIVAPVYNNGENTNSNNYRGRSLVPTTYKILFNILLSKLTPHVNKILGIITGDFDVIYQPLTRYSAFTR